MSDPLYVVFGSGPLGLSVMNALIAKGIRLRMVNRSGKASVPDGVAVYRADVLTGENVMNAVEGASVVFQCVNPPYDKWAGQFPAMQDTILNAAAAVNAKLVIGENLYMYGDTNGATITEDLPFHAATRKGRVRAAMALDALRAHAEGKVKVAIGRGSDFFGPGVLRSMMGERQIGFAVQGKRASLVGNIDVPHSFTYINDFGKALVTLAENDSADGAAWHVPNVPAMTQRECMTLVFHELDREPDMSSMGTMMMRIGGLFIPEARESVEMMYEFEKPFVVDSSRFEKQFGWNATDVRTAIRKTVQWYLEHYEHQKM